MALKRCENGHFYDCKEHDICPFCEPEESLNDYTGDIVGVLVPEDIHLPVIPLRMGYIDIVIKKGSAYRLVVGSNIVDNQYVSLRHCLIKLRQNMDGLETTAPPTFYIKDLKSKYGTYIDGTKLKPDTYVDMGSPYQDNYKRIILGSEDVVYVYKTFRKYYD